MVVMGSINNDLIKKDTDYNNTPEKNKILKGTLYLVPTPIGNLSDITSRALKVLAGVDFIAAEDTRNTGFLLAQFGISKPMISYFEHNKQAKGKIIVDRIIKGESCALVTDAGTPAISDPGEDLVRLCAENNVNVTSLPGCCAAICALSLSALPTGRFCFEGFLSTNKNERLEHLNSLVYEERTLIFYEAPHKLKKTLSDMHTILGNRRISLCRELTKLNEEVIRTDIKSAMDLYENINPKGEFVLIIEGSKDKKNRGTCYPEDPSEHVDLYISQGMPKMDAIKKAAKERGMPKSELYKLVNN